MSSKWHGDCRAENAVLHVHTEFCEGLDVDEALLKLNEDLDISLANIRQDTAGIKFDVSNRDRLKQHLLKCCEKRKVGVIKYIQIFPAGSCF